MAPSLGCARRRLRQAWLVAKSVFLGRTVCFPRSHGLSSTVARFRFPSLFFPVFGPMNSQNLARMKKLGQNRTNSYGGYEAVLSGWPYPARSPGVTFAWNPAATCKFISSHLLVFYGPVQPAWRSRLYIAVTSTITTNNARSACHCFITKYKAPHIILSTNAPTTTTRHARPSARRHRTQWQRGRLPTTACLRRAGPSRRRDLPGCGSRMRAPPLPAQLPPSSPADQPVCAAPALSSPAFAAGPGLAASPAFGPSPQPFACHQLCSGQLSLSGRERRPTTGRAATTPGCPAPSSCWGRRPPGRAAAAAAQRARHQPRPGT